jgi:hypothetical protein
MWVYTCLKHGTLKIVLVPLHATYIGVLHVDQVEKNHFIYQAIHENEFLYIPISCC